MDKKAQRTADAAKYVNANHQKTLSLMGNFDLVFGLCLLVVIVLVLLSSCVPAGQQPQQEKAIPAIVHGTVTDLTCPRTEPVVDTTDDKFVVVNEAVYCMYVDGVRYPVTAETWVKAWTGDEITLLCDRLPCVLEK